MRLPFIIFCLLLAGFSFGQIDFQNYVLLQPEGTVPEDFTGITKDKITKEKKSNKGKDKTKAKIIATTNYSIDRILQKGDVLFNDPVTKYVEDVLSKVLEDEPELRSELRVYTIKSNIVNAFSTRQGILFVTTGLLARLENEAQLAFILAHEISHYTENHVVKSFEETDRILSGKGKFKSASEDQKIKFLSRYSKDKEFEADEFGFELYEKSNFAISEVESALELLIYSDLNFTNEPFDQSCLNDNALFIPSIYFPSTIAEIEKREGDYDDSEASHPNITKRKARIKDLVSGDTENGKLFLISKERFEDVKKACRFESVHMYLSNDSPAEAIYTAEILLKENPNNKYLEFELAKAWYKIIKYSASNQMNEVLSDLDDVEGEPKAVHYLMNKLSDFQKQIVGVKTIYNIAHKYNDPNINLYYENALKTFIHSSDPDWEKFYSITYQEKLSRIQIDTNVMANDTTLVDEVIEEEKLEKLKSIKPSDFVNEETDKSSLEETFHFYAFADIVNNRNFIDLRERLEKEEKFTTKDDFESGLYEPETKEERKEIKKLNRKGAALGIKDLIVLSPEFQKWHYKKGFKPESSEKGNVSIGDTYRESCKKLNLNYQVLDKKGFGETDVQGVNDLNELKSYVLEILMYDMPKGYLPTNYDRVKEIIERRKVKHVLVPLVIVEQNKNITKSQWFFLIPPFTPIFLISAVIPKDNILIANILLNVETNEIEHIFFKFFKQKSSSIPFVQAHIYDIIYQISREKKGGEK